MTNKIVKFFKISLIGATLLALSPVVGYAQYYNYNYNNYNYTPLNVTTTNATNITSGSAIFNGLVNGNNLYNTYNITTWFEYGTNSNFGYSTLKIHSNSGYANYSANVANLSADTIYYFRAVAQGPQGVVYGSTNSFRTNFASIINTNTENNNSLNPTIVTNPATSVSARSANLNSLIINSVDNPATTWFEWGTIPTLGNITPMIALGTLPAAKHINTITGLAPATTYYFRAVVQNSSSRINGATLSFVTNNVVSQSNTVEKTTENTTATSTSEKNQESVTNTSVLESIGSALGAGVIGAGSFFPVSILGWLFLIILILVLIIIAKHLHHNLSNKKINEDKSGH